MRAKWVFILLFIWVAGWMSVLINNPTIVKDLSESSLTIGVAIFGGVSVVLLFILYQSVLRPITAIRNGMDLVRAQDFSSRLSKVGQHDADLLVGMFNNVLGRIKEERLRNIEQNHFLQLLIQASPMGIAILDYNGRISLANSSFHSLLNYHTDNLSGSRLDELQGDTARAIISTPQGETRTVRVSNNNVLRISRLDFMESGFNRPYIMVEVLTEEVMKAEKESYGKVIRLIAHEVNNTMGGLNSILETLSLVLAEERDLSEAIESCRERCLSMSSFITAYADVVRIPEAKLMEIDLASHIERMIPFLEGLTGIDIDLQFNRPTVPIMVKADAMMLEQIMVNIVKNSVESIHTSGNHGEIIISLSKDGPHITVADNGAGINSATAEKLFSPFFSTKRGGQGIGLTMVSDILRQHCCRFSLRTEPDGLTRFKIEFPK